MFMMSLCGGPNPLPLGPRLFTRATASKLRTLPFDCQTEMPSNRQLEIVIVFGLHGRTEPSGKLGIALPLPHGHAANLGQALHLGASGRTALTAAPRKARICPESCRKAFWRNAPAERRLTLPPYAA